MSGGGGHSDAAPHIPAGIWTRILTEINNERGRDKEERSDISYILPLTCIHHFLPLDLSFTVDAFSGTEGDWEERCVHTHTHTHTHTHHF